MDTLGIGQKIKILSYKQMVYAQAIISPREWDAYSSLELSKKNIFISAVQKARSRDNQHEK